MIKLLIATALASALGACTKASVNDGLAISQPLSDTQISTIDTSFDFENGVAGVVPVGFTQTSTGKPQALDWKIVDDSGNKVAAQLAKNGGDYYNLLVLNEPGYLNFSASAKIKATAGDEDQGGGLVWRYVDNNNYYLARYNPLEGNFRFYRVVNGNRKTLNDKGSNIKSGEWFTMTIDMSGNKITCSLNGKKMIETTDDTFKSAGRIGFWSKADAQSYFDELTIKPL